MVRSETAILADVRFREAVRSRWPEKRVVGHLKTSRDEPGHPFGQWSVVADLLQPLDPSGVARASLDFVAPGAPRDVLCDGERFVLYVGPNAVADVEIAAAFDNLDESVLG